MKTILAFSGSNSSTSINQQLVKHTGTLIKEHSVKLIDLRDYALPIFSIDIQNNEDFPENALKLQKLFEEADGFLMSIPEHNSSFPAFFKNTIDWLSRIEKNLFNHKPILLMSTSPGRGGGKSALEQSSKVLSGYLKGDIIGQFSLPSFGHNTIASLEGISISDIELSDALKSKLESLEQAVSAAIVSTE